MFQTQPRCTDAIRGLIHQLLATLLTATPDASHIDLYLITERHRPSDRLVPRYSLATSLPRGRRTKVSTLQDQPLTDWANFSRSLRAGQCRLLGLNDFPPSPVRDRFRALDDSRILMCPVIGPRSDFLGAICLGWPARERAGSRAATEGVTISARRIADQVARVIALQADLTAQPLAFPPAEVMGISGT